jgi:hypothetical protein
MKKWIEDAFYSFFKFRPSLWIAVSTNGYVLESLILLDYYLTFYIIS